MIDLARAEMRQLLREVFPDRRGALSDEAVDAALALLPEDVQKSAFGQVLGLVTGREIPDVEADRVVGYYDAHATHERPGVHRFTGVLPMVRLTLPDEQRDIATELGIVFAGDHRLYTLPVFRQHYEERLDFEIAKVELLTPPRDFGARFAAVATYSVFDAAGAVRAWVLEAGLATGEPMVLFLSADGEEIIRRSWYVPTPLSSDKHFYRGHAEFADDGAPLSLHVDVLASRDSAPHMSVSVRYEQRAPGAPAASPMLKTLEAASRLPAIAAWLGRPIDGPKALTALLAAAGRQLDWEVRP